MKNYIKRFECSIKANWESVAIVEPHKSVITYGDLALVIKQYHHFWKENGLKKGDRIAICAKNSARWAELYMAIVTGGYVAVLAPNNLSQVDIIEIIKHSDSKLLYAENTIIDSIGDSFISCPISVHDIESNVNPCQLSSPSFCDADLMFFVPEQEDICTILYTSGSSGNPKGALLSVNYFDINIDKVYDRYTNLPGDSAICVSPFSHIIGLGMDIISSLCAGMNLIVIDTFVPSKLLAIFQQYKPRRIFSAPVIICNLVEHVMHNVGICLESCNEQDCCWFFNTLMSALGGNIEAITTGGAPMPKDIESFLVSKVHFPLISGYGSTEGGYLSLGKVGSYKERSCGTIVEETNFRIASSNSECEPGEIQIRSNIFSGYYNNDEATKAAFTEDGWFKTGDMGVIDKEKSLFITGRCKDMLLTSNGQNIYPDEIENVLNSQLIIAESLLIQRGEKFHAIIVLDRKMIILKKLSDETIAKIVDDAVLEASKHMPGFVIINTYEVREEPLERTPKGNIKRFLYL